MYMLNSQNETTALKTATLCALQTALAAADTVGVLTRALPAAPPAGAARLLELAQKLVGGERRIARQFAQQFLAAGGLQAPMLARRVTSVGTLKLANDSGGSAHTHVKSFGNQHSHSLGLLGSADGYTVEKSVQAQVHYLRPRRSMH